MVRQSTDSILSEKIFNTLKDISEQNKHSSTSNICGGRIQKTSIASQDKFKGPVFDTPYNPNETFNRHESGRKLGQIKLVDDRNDIKDDSGEYSGPEELAKCNEKEDKDQAIKDICEQIDIMGVDSSNDSGQYRKRRRRNFQKKYKLGYDYRNYPNVTKWYLSSLSKFPERYITERCICNAEDACSYYFLKGTAMKECHCRSHHRFLPNNTRVKMENAVIHHVVKYLKEKPVRMMSLGVGAFLQDLMIILKLAEAGIKSIDIAMVEPNPCLKAYPDFKYFVNKIRVLYGMKYISVKTYLDINELDSKDRFDVIYAIDYDECNSIEYLHEHRHIEVHNDEVQTSDPEKPTWDLIKVSNFLTPEHHGLIIASKLKHILHMTPQSLPFYGMP